MPTVAKITTETKDNTCIVHISGEVDISNLSDLESFIKPVLENIYIKQIVLDCSDLMFIDSKVVGYFAYLYKTLDNSERGISIAAANETINDILTLVGLSAIIPQFSTVQESLKKLTTVSGK